MKPMDGALLLVMLLAIYGNPANMAIQLALTRECPARTYVAPRSISPPQVPRRWCVLFWALR